MLWGFDSGFIIPCDVSSYSKGVNETLRENTSINRHIDVKMSHYHTDFVKKEVLKK